MSTHMVTFWTKFRRDNKFEGRLIKCFFFCCILLNQFHNNDNNTKANNNNTNNNTNANNDRRDEGKAKGTNKKVTVGLAISGNHPIGK